MRSIKRRYGIWFRLGLVTLVTVMTAKPSPQDLPGLIVEEIAADSPAAKVGLKAGDYVLSYDGKPLPSPASLQAAAENTFGKEEVALRIRRGEETLTLIVPAGRLSIQVRPELPTAALTLYEEGKAAQKAKKTGEVTIAWTAAAKAVQERGDNASAVWLYGRVGEILEGQQQWKEARASHLAAWELVKESGDRATQSRTLVPLGRCSRRLNDVSEAGRWFEQALQVDTAGGYEMWAAGDLESLGHVAHSRGELEPAQDYYNRSLAIRERLAPHSLPVAASLNNLGNVAWSRDDLEAAQAYHRRALAIRERLAANSLDLAASLNNLGIIASSRGDLEAAQDHYSRALVNYERLARSLEVAITLNNLGGVAYSRGDLPSAQDYFRRALAIRERLIPNSLDIAYSLNNLGAIASARGDLEGAQDYHHRALAIYERLAPNSLNVAMSLGNLGTNARDRGDLQGADDLYRRALGIHERLAPNSLNVAWSLNSLGTVAATRGDLPTAQDYYTRSFAIRERLAPNSLNVAQSLVNLGTVAHRRGELRAAQDYYSRALTTFERLAPTSLDTAESLANMGNLALKERRFSDARSFLTRAVDIVESHRSQISSTESRAFLVARHTGPYRGLLHADLALDDLAAAFDTLERARARSLLDLLAEANIDVQQGIAPALKQREQASHARIAWIQRELIKTHSQTSPDKKKIAQLEEQLKQVEREREQLKMEIRQNHPRYAELQYPTPLGLKAIQDLLEPQTALLEYALDEERSVLFVVTKTDAFVAELPSEASLSERVKQLRQTLVNTPQRNTFPTYIEQARALHRLLIEPAVKSLKGKRQLVIVPDGILHYLPFEVLLSSGDERSLTTMAPSRWPYFVRDYGLSYAPSATVLASLHRSRKTRPAPEKVLLAYADPAYGAREPSDANPVRSAMRSAFGEATPWRLEQLPQTLEEANRIAALYPKEKVRVFLQKEAREENVKMESLLDQYRFVHFAAHGLLNETKPQFSGLVLSLPAEENRQSSIVNRQSEDGLLQVYEIFDLKLNADLVVLSACETGLGKDVKGEGLVGLTRAFLYAGTPSVVVSLWKVSDRSTAELMVSFYQGLKGAASKAEALRQAQVKLIREGRYAHPYYWAPFILVGEAR